MTELYCFGEHGLQLSDCHDFEELEGAMHELHKDEEEPEFTCCKIMSVHNFLLIKILFVRLPSIEMGQCRKNWDSNLGLI